MDQQHLATQIARELGIRSNQAAQTIALLDDGNTVPFIARYRKEVTGSLDEDQIRQVRERADYVRRLEERREAILESIRDQGKLTPDLERQLRQAGAMQELEDLYLPFRPKRRTRATMARERGLVPLAEVLLSSDQRRGAPEQIAQDYVNDEVPTPEQALAGARDIVAEIVSDSAEARQTVRSIALREGIVTSSESRKGDESGKYADYYEYAERLRSMPHHRVLALNRGESDEALRVKIELPDAAVERLCAMFLRHPRSIFAEEVQRAVEDGYKRLIQPAIERELRADRTKAAETHAISVFAQNLRGLLSQPPVANTPTLAIDPGYRTGSKVAVVDATGRYLDHATIYPHAPQRRWDQAKDVVAKLCRRHDVGVIAVGNGTASRETEAMVAEMIQEGDVQAYVMVSESGASVYSASKLARQEMPDLDVTIRGAVSIARRLQDPLAELVKIEPRSIGVGLYQHDVDQKALASALDQVVESVVNYVGVDANTASPALLSHVAGLSSRVATNIVAHRNENGPFQNRRALLKVKGLGPKAFEQCAGFVRVKEGDTRLDDTAIHPESYSAARDLFSALDMQEGDLGSRSAKEALTALSADKRRISSLAKKLGVGMPTLADIIDSALKPGRDPRDELPAPILRTDVLKMADLHEGMLLKGTVRNVVDFGAFVDIGVKQNGLVHISQMADHYVSNPLDVVGVGDVIEVRVVSIDADRGRIGLSMKSEAP